MRPFLPIALILALVSPIQAAEPIRIVTLGDSITKAVRPGVKADETFSAYLQAALKKEGIAAEVINVGVGSETTELALARFDKAVLARKPQVVTIMYGANDHWIDKGKMKPRVPPEKFIANLTKMVAEVRKAGGKPILMTTPITVGKAYDDDDEGSAKRLREYVQLTRDLARELKVPLVDHYAHWETAAKTTDLKTWITDPWHPNPLGHREMAKIMVPVVLKVIREETANPK